MCSCVLQDHNSLPSRSEVPSGQTVSSLQASSELIVSSFFSSQLGKTALEHWDKKTMVLHVITQRHQLHVSSHSGIEEQGWSAGDTAGSVFPAKRMGSLFCTSYTQLSWEQLWVETSGNFFLFFLSSAFPFQDQRMP